MSYRVDTDQVINYLKGRKEARTLLASLWQERLAISLITYGEVYEGIYYSHTRTEQERAFRAFLESIKVVGLDRRTMERFARIRGILRAQGLPLDAADVLIASTAIEHGLTLVTGNKKHFARIPDLSLY